MTPEERAEAIVGMVEQMHEGRGPERLGLAGEVFHPRDVVPAGAAWPKRWLVAAIAAAMAEERVRSAEVIARWKGRVSRGAMVRAILAREDGPSQDEGEPGVSSSTEIARWTADLPAPHVLTLVVELERDDGRVRGLQVRLFGDLGHIATIDLPMAFLGPALAGLPVEG